MREAALAFEDRSSDKFFAAAEFAHRIQESFSRDRR